MLRKSPASNAWAAIVKNTDFSKNFKKNLGVTKFSKFLHFFSYLKFFCVFIINASTILFSKYGKIERWNHWVIEVILLLDTRVNIYVRKRRLLLVLKLIE